MGSHLELHERALLMSPYLLQYASAYESVLSFSMQVCETSTLNTQPPTQSPSNSTEWMHLKPSKIPKETLGKIVSKQH